MLLANIQIVTGAEVTVGNCFPEVGEILPEAEGNISPAEGKQFPIVTDNASLYLFCYTLSRNACRQCTVDYITQYKVKAYNNLIIALFMYNDPF